jgi:hypothetical protein
MDFQESSSQRAVDVIYVKLVYQNLNNYFFHFFILNVPIFLAQQPPVGQGLRIIQASRSHSDTPQTVGLLWMSDKPDAGNSI